MLILGIDPGLATMGYGVIESDRQRLKLVDYGAVLTDKDMIFAARLRRLFDGVEQLISMYRPDAVAIEELFFNKNVTTAINVAQARGAVLVAAARAMQQVYEYTPLQVKQAITGYGRAEKTQMQAMVKSLLKMDSVPKPDDAADALAVAICHSQSAVMQANLGIR